MDALLDANGKEIKVGSTVKHIPRDSPSEGAPMRVLSITGRSVTTDIKKTIRGLTASGRPSTAVGNSVTIVPVFLASMCEVIDP